MNPPPSSLESRLLTLLLAVRENDDPGARTQLNELLREDPAARAAIARLLVDEQALINRLRQDGMVAMLQPKPRIITSSGESPPQRQGLRKLPKAARGWPALAAVAVLLLSGYLGWRALHTPSAAGVVSATQAVAVLKEDADAVWKETSPTPRRSLVPGTLTLVSGMAAIEFTSGARVLLEGPAELELISGMEAFCRGGKLRAHVPPPAQGFTIVTPSSRIVDRGTVFGLSVRKDGSTLVKVMQGVVELRHPQKVYQIKTNAAAMIDARGNPSQVKTPDEVFPSEEKFNERLAAGARRSAARWQATAATLAQDPATLLSYNFTESLRTSRSVRNHVPGAALESHGTLVGVGWTQGRWPGKHALEFKGRSDSMLFKLQRTSPAATLIAWVRVDSLPNPYHILLMPDYRQASALQWMIDHKGELRLALTTAVDAAGSPSGWDGPVKVPAISNSVFGRWVFLASTYDSNTGKVVHYRDGKQIGTGYFEHKLPVEFGSFSCGNWSDDSVTVASGGSFSASSGARSFVGSIDELAVLSRALTPSEIQHLHDQGKP